LIFTNIKMSFNKDYNQLYNLTLGIVQNIYTNMFTSVLEIDFQIDTMLSKSFVDYEPLFFESCIYLLKFSLYYIIFLCSFEIISFVLNMVSLHSMVTKRYIKKYHRLLEHNDYLCFEIEDAKEKIDIMEKHIEKLNIENKRLNNDYQLIFELVKKIENKTTVDKTTQFTDSLSHSGPKKKVIRKAAKKATKTIRQLASENLINIDII